MSGFAQEMVNSHLGTVSKKKKRGVKTKWKFGLTSSTVKLPAEVAKKMGIANTAFVLRDYPKAIEYFNQVLEEVPTAHEAYHSLGLISEETGDAEKALNFFIISAYLKARDSDLWLKVAEMSDKRGLKRQADYCYNRACKSNPCDWSLHEIRINRALADKDNQSVRFGPCSSLFFFIDYFQI